MSTIDLNIIGIKKKITKHKIIVLVPVLNIENLIN